MVKDIQQCIDNKISELTTAKINKIVNERLIKLVKIGLKHELTIENMKQYFKEVGEIKIL